MPIEYNPPRLRSVIEGPFAEKRLKNRTGYAMDIDTTEVIVQGLILKVDEFVKKYRNDFPDHHVWIQEDCCDAVVGSLNTTARAKTTTSNL